MTVVIVHSALKIFGMFNIFVCINGGIFSKTKLVCERVCFEKGGKKCASEMVGSYRPGFESVGSVCRELYKNSTLTCFASAEEIYPFIILAF